MLKKLSFILEQLRQDEHLVQVLIIIQSLGLKDAWLAAGTVRNAIWNSLSDQPLFDWTTDMDVVFYDKTLSADRVRSIQADLKSRYPQFNWEVTNQALMHVYSSNTLPYLSICDAISKYPERCTALALRLKGDNEFEVFVPYGFDDILTFSVRPTPHFQACPERLSVYHRRIAMKNWSAKWPQLRYYDN